VCNGVSQWPTGVDGRHIECVLPRLCAIAEGDARVMSAAIYDPFRRPLRPILPRPAFYPSPAVGHAF